MHSLTAYTCEQALGQYCGQHVFGDPAQPEAPVPAAALAGSPAEHQCSEPSPEAYGVRHGLRALCALARKQAVRGVHVARRHGHVTLGLLGVAYQLAYLLQLSPYFSPALHLTRSRLARDDGSAAVRSTLPPMHTLSGVVPCYSPATVTATMFVCVRAVLPRLRFVDASPEGA